MAQSDAPIPMPYRASLVDRAKRIILQPKQEWPIIDTEPATVRSLYVGYILPLAAIGPIARIIGLSIFGMRVPFLGTIRVPIATEIERAVVSYILSLIGVYVIALIVDALAPSFGGQKNQVQALKVVAYSYTAAWLAGIFGLVPMLAILGILGLYSIYLLYTGLPVLMKSPPDKALGYTAVTIICGIVLYFIIGMIVASFFAFPSMAGVVPR